MMKVQLKQILIAVLVLAAAAVLLLAGYQWYTRPKDFSSLLPFL